MLLLKFSINILHWLSLAATQSFSSRLLKAALFFTTWLFLCRYYEQYAYYFFVSQVHHVEVNDFSTQQLEIAIIIVTIIDTHLTIFITL